MGTFWSIRLNDLIFLAEDREEEKEKELGKTEEKDQEKEEEKPPERSMYGRNDRIFLPLLP